MSVGHAGRLSERYAGLKGVDDPAFVRMGDALLITGGDAHERMEALMGQIAVAEEAGVDAKDMLVLCADPSVAERVRMRLDGRPGDCGQPIRVETCRRFACSILEESGIGARILSAYETDFLVEDVKTLGTRPGRLRELLKFLYRGWTELSDEDSEWLFTAEEINTFDFLRDELSYLHAVIEPQVSNLATKELRVDAELGAANLWRRVFVLDYQNVSRASQLLCQLVAGEGLVVVASGECCVEVSESYPHLEGVGDFVRYNPAVRVVSLDDASVENASAAADACERVERVWQTPQEEVAGIADFVAEAVAAGDDPSQIAVMTNHPWWTQQVGRELRDRGVPANVWHGTLRLRGDIRELDGCLVPRVVTLLRLLADGKDAVAWRSWFGFGDYLTRSNLFAAMRAGGVATGDVRRDLEVFGYDLGADLDPLFYEVRDMRGPDLIGYLVQTLAGKDAPIPAVLKSLYALGADADARAMIAEIDRRQFFAGVPSHEGVVVTAFEQMAGLDFEQVLVVGFVNGLFPKAQYFDLTEVSINKQKSMGEHDLRSARAMSRMGRKLMCVSSFEKADYDFARRTSVKQSRIFAADDAGVPFVEVERSMYADVLLGRA